MRLRYSMVVMILLVANAAAACNLYRVLLPQKERIRCIAMDLRESPGETAWKLMRAAMGR